MRDRPLECCGLLVGSARRLEYAVPMPNVLQSATRYRIDDGEHVGLRRALRRFTPALSIVGVYHSHPKGDAQPSATDIAQAMYPEWCYVIVGLESSRPTVRAFRIKSGRATDLRIRWR